MLLRPLFAHAARRADDVAVIDATGSHTYGQIAAWAAGVARQLPACTDRPAVGLLLPSGAGFVACFYGALLAGKTAVPLNFLLGDREIAHVVQDSGIDTVVAIGPLAERIKGLSVNVVDLATLLPGVVDNVAVEARIAALRPADVAALIYTSGTGGLPKGVPLTYENLQSDVDAAIAHVELEGRHKFLGLVPLFHVFGLNATMLAPIQLGATIVYLSRFNPVATVKAIREHGISIVAGVPSMYAAIVRLKDPTPDDFRTVYAMISGGEPLPAGLCNAFEKRYGVTLYNAYGMSETSLAIAMNTPKSYRAGSVGKPVPGIKVKIVNDAGEAAAAGESGDIWVRGPMVASGYRNLPVESADAFTSDGYFKTGDVGWVDSDGFVYISGRRKELIIVAGEKASPAEIEETLLMHRSVAEAAVIGRKDPLRGEVVMAFVIPRAGETPLQEELRDFCRDKGLAQWKIPREIRTVQELPRSPTGKVLKRLLAEQI